MLHTLRRHWPEYLIEACGLGAFMISASVFASLLQHPASPVRQALPDPALRRALMGAAMGLTAIGIIYSPWGMRSGAHINPAVTLAFWRLGKIDRPDAAFYMIAQFAGAAAGISLAAVPLERFLDHPSVNYVATLPGEAGRAAAFAAEAVISFVLMLAILSISNAPRVSRLTGLTAGALVALYITIEDPISGMSMNPARTFGSAVRGDIWHGLWIYLTAPPLAMLAAAELYARWPGARAVLCAKLHHENRMRCIFRCSYPMPAA